MADSSIRIAEQAGLALVELSGEVTAADVVEAARALHALPNWDIRYDVIWDGRGITSLVIGHDDVIEMVDAKVEKSIGKEITIAVRELDHMMASLCALLLKARQREAVVVSTLEEALAEVGLDRLPETLTTVVG